MNSKILDKKIPTAIGLTILLTGVLTAVFILGRGGILNKLKPSLNAQTSEVTISNVTDKEFTVSWVTKEPVIGFLKYGESTSLDSTASDNRDEQTGQKEKYRTHYVTISNLQPEKKYFFKIGNKAGIKQSLSDSNGKPYQITTGPSLGNPGQAEMATGTVVKSDGSPAQDTVVVLTASKSAPLSALTDKQGGWVIFLNKARTKSLSSWAILDEATELKFEVYGPSDNTSVLTNKQNSSPLPKDIVLGHAPYDFTDINQTELAEKPESLPSEPEQEEEEETTSMPASPDTKAPENFPTDPIQNTNQNTNEVTITYPATNGDKIATQTPQFRGEGPAGKVLTLKTLIPELTKTVTVENNQTWKYTPDNKLSMGNNRLDLTYVNSSGNQQTVSREFEITNEEDIPGYTATPSASVAPSPSPTPKPSPRKTMPSTESGVPETGIVGPTFVTFVAGVILLILGFSSKISLDKMNVEK